MKSCIFCELLEGKTPSYTVYEDEHAKIILDIDPINEGHMLIIAKEHCADADLMEESVYMHIQMLARRMIRVLKQVYDHCDGYTVLQNGGLIGTSGHYHLHVIPRYLRDGFFIMSGESVCRAKPRVVEKLQKGMAELALTDADKTV